jgi:hypothetical protein
VADHVPDHLGQRKVEVQIVGGPQQHAKPRLAALMLDKPTIVACGSMRTIIDHVNSRSLLGKLIDEGGAVCSSSREDRALIPRAVAD